VITNFEILALGVVSVGILSVFERTVPTVADLDLPNDITGILTTNELELVSSRVLSPMERSAAPIK
jgi:hypothetical protein